MRYDELLMMKKIIQFRLYVLRGLTKREILDYKSILKCMDRLLGMKDFIKMYNKNRDIYGMEYKGKLADLGDYDLSQYQEWD